MIRVRFYDWGCGVLDIEKELELTAEIDEYLVQSVSGLSFEATDSENNMEDNAVLWFSAANEDQAAEAIRRIIGARLSSGSDMSFSVDTVENRSHSPALKKGCGIFGKAYEVMLENDLHSPASIDRALLREMVLIDDCSAPYLYSSVRRYDMKKHELFEFSKQFAAKSERETIQNAANFTREIAYSYDVDFKDMLFGGTEKQILERGTDWCADMARVGAVLLGCLDIPCRIVNLIDTSRAYNGHVVCEAFYEGHYGVVDFIHGYVFYDSAPISAYKLLSDKTALREYPDEYRDLYSAAAISEYDPTDEENDYTVTGPNEYYMKLIYGEHDSRWLMGEDE